MEKQSYEEELWKQIPGFEGIYFVSNFGRVKVLACARHFPCGQVRRYKEKFLAKNKVKAYRTIDLRDPISTKKKKEGVHVLVARAFLGAPPTPRHEVNHIDGVKSNCRADNLEWVVSQRNNEHALETGLKPRMLLHHNGNTYPISEWAKKLGIRDGLIRSRIKKGYSVKDALDADGRYAKLHKSEVIRAANYAHMKKYKNGLTGHEWAKILGISFGAFKARIRNFKDERLVYAKGRFPRSGAVIKTEE